MDGDIARPLEEKETERYLKGKDDTWQAADGHPLMPLDLGGAEGEKEPSGETGASGKPESTEKPFAGIGASGKPESTEEPSGQTNASGEKSVQGPTAKTAGAPESIALSADSLMLGVKEKRMLGVLFTPSDRSETVSFSVSPKSVAVVAPDGTVKALKKGTATITAKSASGLTASCKVIVRDAPKKISVADGLKLGVGETCALAYSLSPGASAGAVTFSSSDASVVTVDSVTGSISALKAGTAAITTRTYNGKSAKCKLTVSVAPESVALSAASLKMSVGQTVALTASTAPAGSCSRTLDYASDKDSVAAVDASGVVRALSPGAGGHLRGNL